jgi:hypothetical protein
MKLKPIVLNDPNMEVAPFTGKYSLCDNRALMLSEATALLAKASEIIADFGNLTGFGTTHRQCATWLEDCQRFAINRKEHFTSGKDFRNGQ